MSEAEYTGTQFHHDLQLQIDPALSDNNPAQDENYNGDAQFYGFDNRTSTEQFAFDVDQSVRPQDSHLQWHVPLQNNPTTPNALNNAASTLNPRAAPFQPQTIPRMPNHNDAANHFHHQLAFPTPTTPSQYIWSNQLHQLGSPINQGQQWVPSTPLRFDRSTQHDDHGVPLGLQSPFTPRNMTLLDANRQPSIHDANLNSIEEILASTAAQGGNQPFPSTTSAAAMTVSSENVARVPMNRNILRDMHRWNQNTYQGPVAQSTQPQYPPTPATTIRHRRGGSVSTQPGQTYDCDSCPKSFGKRYELNHHKRWHQRDLACQLCGKTFTVAKDLRRHFTAKHDRTEKHLFCNILGCKFRQEGFHRLDHLKRHHERKHPEYPWTPPGTSSLASRMMDHNTA